MLQRVMFLLYVNCTSINPFLKITYIIIETYIFNFGKFPQRRKARYIYFLKTYIHHFLKPN